MKNRNLNNSDNWATPDDLLQYIQTKYFKGELYFDPCPLNHDIKKWDGLEIEWQQHNYVNPPYSRKLKEAFIRKALEQRQLGKIVVMLLPVSTSTKIFHEIILPNCDIEFLKGRVKFKGINTKGELVSNACGMHDSMIVRFK